MATLLVPYCQAVYERVSKLYGARFGSFQEFSNMYSSKYLSKAFGVPVARDVTFRVRLNPNCSAFTNLVVDINAQNWYETLCETLNATALTSAGKPLTEWPVNQLCLLNSVSVQYKTPLSLPVGEQFQPIAAPLAYSTSKTEQTRVWFDAAIAFMGLSLGEHIYQSVPNSLGATQDSVDAKDPDDLAWQYITSFARNKVDLKAFFEKTFDSMTSMDDSIKLTTALRQKVLNHMYKVMGNMLTNHSAVIKDAFLSEAITSLQTQLHVTSFAENAPTEALLIEETFTLDEDLYAESTFVAGKEGEDADKKKKGWLSRQWSKGKNWMAKQKEKRSERSLEKAKRDQQLAQDRADLKLREAQIRRIQIRERNLAKKNKKNVPPSEVAPKPNQSQIDLLLETVHNHPISMLLGDLFVLESSKMKDAQLSMLQLVAEITYGGKVTFTRDEQSHKKTVVTIQKEKEQPLPRVVVVDESKKKVIEQPKQEKEKAAALTSKLESSVVLVGAPITVPGMPSLTEFVVSKPTSTNIGPRHSGEHLPPKKEEHKSNENHKKDHHDKGKHKGVVTMSPIDAAKTYGSTHAQALRFVLQNRDLFKSQTDLFLYSDKLLGINASAQTLKASLVRSNANNPLQASFQIESLGQTFHVIN